ncbi:MAG: hypothetical protein IH977_00785 [Nitrospinae bacterium]|nr:hypothetical protein [Nitrospinota bacterium]
MIALTLGALLVGWSLTPSPILAIDVTMTLEKAKKVLAAGREPLDKAQTPEEAMKVFKAADKAIRIGADPETEPCGTSAILKTKYYWLEYFGRREAAESKRQKREIRAPDEKIQEWLAMPNLEVEIGLCGKEESFADGADVALQQGSKNIMPVDKGKPSRGRKVPGTASDYVSRFSARFSYQDLDPNAKTNIVVFFPDRPEEIHLEADFSKIK